MIFTRFKHAEHISSNCFGNEGDWLECFLKNPPMFPLIFLQSHWAMGTRRSGNLGRINEEAKVLPRVEWRWRWEEETCLWQLILVSLASWVVSEKIFWNRNKAHWSSSRCPETSSAPFAAGSFAFHTSVFALHFSRCSFYPGGEPRERMEKVFLILRPQTKTIKICSDWTSA